MLAAPTSFSGWSARCRIHPEPLHGDVLKKVTACLLFVFLALALSAPPVAYARTTKTKQTKAQKTAAKQYKKYSKQYNKQQKKQLKAQQKANKKFNKGRPTITVT